MQNKLSDPNVRKAIYYFFMLVGAVLTGLGVGTADTWNQLADQLTQILPALLLLASGGLAKAHVADASDGVGGVVSGTEWEDGSPS